MSVVDRLKEDPDIMVRAMRCESREDIELLLKAEGITSPEDIEEAYSLLELGDKALEAVAGGSKKGGTQVIGMAAFRKNGRVKPTVGKTVFDTDPEKYGSKGDGVERTSFSSSFDNNSFLNNSFSSNSFTTFGGWQ